MIAVFACIVFLYEVFFYFFNNIICLSNARSTLRSYVFQLQFSVKTHTRKMDKILIDHKRRDKAIYPKQTYDKSYLNVECISICCQM